VRVRLKELASQYPRYGYLMLHSLLKGEGLVVNRKHAYRLYTEEALQVRTKKSKKMTRPRQPLKESFSCSLYSNHLQLWPLFLTAAALANEDALMEALTELRDFNLNNFASFHSSGCFSLRFV
jgi:hypothetical protein